MQAIHYPEHAHSLAYRVSENGRIESSGMRYTQTKNMAQTNNDQE